MIWLKLLRVDDSYIVTIPKEEVERLNLSEGQLIAIEILPAVINSDNSTEVGVAFEESWQRNEPGYRYLAEH
jgi:bifunctional DNA-binding transcriptional regulator/antitoxin component of YhaV-PrlF toxin-antitoxin module